MRSISLLAFTCLIFSGAAAQVTGLEGWNIFLDPGHSARENMGIYNYSEAEKNLRVALALRDLLMTRTDIDTVYLSRTNDLQLVGLSQRSDMANTLAADWFHSIHSDASSSPIPNSTLLLWGQLLNGSEKSPPGGSRMSDFMVDNLTRGMRTTTRGSRGDCSFYRSFITNACSSGGPYLSVNRRTTMPSELSESGFHTSSVQNQRNMNEEWKHLEARTFFWSILDFWSIPRPPERIITGFVTDAETGQALNGATVTIGGETYTTDTHASLFRFYSGDPDLLRNGFYYLENVSPGAQTVAVAAPGFEAEEFLVEPVDSFFTFFDVQLVSNIPPTVVSSTPEEGTGAFRIVDPIVINFSRGMNRASVESAFSIEPAVGGRFLWSNNDFTLTVRPDSLLPLTAMTLRLAGSATGAFGDPFDGDGDGVGGDDFVISFTTGPADTQAPGIADTYPSIRQTGIELDPIVTVVINEEVDPSSISPDQVRVITSSGDAVAGVQAHAAVAETSVFSFFPSEVLQPLTSYIVTLAPGLKDLVGNQRTTQQQFNFSTGSTTVERDIVDDFESDLTTNWWEPGRSGSTAGIVPGPTSRSAETQIVHLGVGSATALRVDFEWEEGAANTLLREYLGGGAPKEVVFDSTYALEAYVFGDGSGTLFRFAVDDRVPVVATGNHEVSPWYTIDWYGWRLVSWRPGRDGTGVWIGDGVLDGNLIFDSIQLSRSAGASAAGSIVIDDLSITRPAVMTGVDQEGDMPGSFQLMQNYPNPFKGRTTIRLNLPEPGPLSVAVFSLLGEEVARLTDDSQYAAGPVELEWDATGVPSGVYFTRARFAGRTRTVQMVVIR